MRTTRTTSGSYSAKGIGGTHVVLLGMDAATIELTDLTEMNALTSKGSPLLKPITGLASSTLVFTAHPIQRFLWGDCTAKPAHRYDIWIVPLKERLPQAPAS